MTFLTAQAESARSATKLPSWFLQTFAVLALIATWTFISWWVDDPSVLPSLAACVEAMLRLVMRGTLVSATQSSFTTLLVGSTICIAVIIPFALVLALSRNLSAILQPMVRFISSVPAIALIPLFIVWFGFSQRAVYATLFYTAAIPLLFSVLTGVQKIPTVYAHGLLTLGASTRRIIADVYLPGAVPGIIVGIRLTLSYGWRAVVAGELIVGSSGLGRLLAESRASNNVDEIIAVMIVIGILFLVIDRLFLYPWDRVFTSRWQAL